MFMRNCVVCVSTAILLFSHSSGFAQVDIFLRFEHGPEPTSGTAVYSWSWIGQQGFSVTSPGGTTVASVFDDAEFESFEEFQNDIVGKWQVFFVNENISVTFQIPEIPSTLFPPLQLVAPLKGDIFFSSEIIQTLVSPPEIEAFGLSLSVTGGAEIVFLGDGAFQAILAPGVSDADVRVARFSQLFVGNVLQSIQGDIDVIDLDEDVFVTTFTNRNSITIVPNLGDVNLDGLVNLLDVTPFVSVLSSGEYQIEADINLDSEVNLLDVAFFVELIL